MSERSELRKQRYKALKELGFTPSEARRLRDNSSINIERAAVDEKRRINAKPFNERSPEESERLDRLNQFAPIEDTRRRIRSDSTRAARYAAFQVWSGKEFPPEYLARIRQYNAAAGLNPQASFGYRRFFYWYVERIADFENTEYAERGDSTIRNERGIPLRKRGKQIQRTFRRTA